jgi:hypothetical protein
MQLFNLAYDSSFDAHLVQVLIENVSPEKLMGYSKFISFAILTASAALAAPSLL